jgi:hypothetical protein
VLKSVAKVLETIYPIWLVALIWMTAVAAMLVYYRRELLGVWREPVLRHPVLIIESDDWGAGPVETQATALEKLADVLRQYRDNTGRHPVMTLALVLAVPDGAAIRRDGQYRHLSLDEPAFATLRAAIDRGRAAGVFALQLHGLEHYWPDALMTVDDPSVRSWLESESPATTERLPSHLQSRWVDAASLPSRPLTADRIATAVTDEVGLYARVFGEKPAVAVPPTFVWNEAVESAWAQQGIEFVVTPGLRSACRDGSGMPNCDTGPLHNGQSSQGLTYLVRDDYFEPERGHRAERALDALARKREQGRPCLLETHRSNFIGDRETYESALNEIDRLYRQALERYPEVRFLSTAELGQVIRAKDPAWIESRTGVRLTVWGARIRLLIGFWRLARLTGLAWLLAHALPNHRPAAS